MAFLEVKKRLLGELEAMEFPRARAVRALHHTGNRSSEDAVNWIIDHENDPDIDQMPQVVLDVDIEPPETFHVSEEMKRKAGELRGRVRMKREDEENKIERNREKDRIRAGKKLLGAKKIDEENERKRYLDLRNIEKEEEKKAREKILQKLGQDKAERRKNHGLPQEGPADVKLSTTCARSKENSFPIMSVEKAECMRECLRSLKRHHKDDATGVRRAFETLLVYVRNVARSPDDERFRKIRLGNPVFQDRVGRLQGGIEFLELCGFERLGDVLLYLPRDKIDMAVLNSAGSQLPSAMTNPFFGVL